MVLGIISIVLGFTVSGFRNFTRYQQYDYAVTTVKTTLQAAHDNAKHAVDGVSYGVKVGTSSITTFKGGTYSGSDPDNVSISFSEVTLLPALSGGGDEIIFSELTGLPSATGTVSITGTNHNGSTTATISNAGVIQ